MECILVFEPIINRVGILVGDFILWALWKERNAIIFRNKRRNLEVIKEVIK